LHNVPFDGSGAGTAELRTADGAGNDIGRVDDSIYWRLPYTLYDKFDGASSNYDGSGRNASDNNTLYFFIWTAI
jgi:hypothetical protein